MRAITAGQPPPAAKELPTPIDTSARPKVEKMAIQLPRTLPKLLACVYTTARWDLYLRLLKLLLHLPQLRRLLALPAWR
jgi:hypothetical protein